MQLKRRTWWNKADDRNVQLERDIRSMTDELGRRRRTSSRWMDEEHVGSGPWPGAHLKMKMTCWMICLQPTWPNVVSASDPWKHRTGLSSLKLTSVKTDGSSDCDTRLWALLQIFRTEVFEDAHRNDVTVGQNTHVATPTVSAAEFSSLNVQIYSVEFFLKPLSRQFDL